MFKSNEEIDAMVDAVYAKAAYLDRGDVLKHDVIQAIVGGEPHEGYWPNVMRRVRSRLLKERGIACWPKVNVGYELLTRRKQLEQLPFWRNRKARSQFRRLRREVTSLPDATLSDHQRRRKEFVMESLREQQRNLKDLERLFDVVTRPSFTAVRRHLDA